MSNNRNKAPNELTKCILWGRSAGRCEFKGCNKILYEDVLTLESTNNSNIAHIVASSPNGPRGDEKRSSELSDKIENLMLLCLEHHKLIDSKPKKYTEKILLDMKKEHEEKVTYLCDNINIGVSELVRFISPIKGSLKCDIEINEIKDAITCNKRLCSNNGIVINIESSYDYNSKEYWNDVNKKLENKFNIYILNLLEDKSNIHFSIFPIAPMPLIIKFGYLIGDKIPSDIYQKFRDSNNWKWKSHEKTNSFKANLHEIKSGNKIALIISLTADISIERVCKVLDVDKIYIIRANKIGVDSISSEKDLIDFWHKYQYVCDEIKNTFAVDEFSLFSAMPVSASFEIGRRYMKGVYPRIRIYDDNNGFFETLTIGG